MIQAILFDLDDTLLGNDADTFVPCYFDLLGEYATKYFPRDKFLQELLICTQMTINNTDATLTNHAVFWQIFAHRTGLDPVEMEHFFDKFYRDIFPQLESVTQQRPCTPTLVQTSFDLGLKVVVATNPLFPRRAIEERIAWAQVPVQQYDYTLVTTMENMHATKPHQAYYEEILAAIDCPPQAALMIGDSWKNDIQPAVGLGLSTYWIPTKEPQPPDENFCTAYGSLEELNEKVQSGWLESL
ncbi:MAG: HAD family hydrolase [Chloroflexi bacterium]|nr:HAD family hydrolase [Chloroflexota bacterium]